MQYRPFWSGLDAYMDYEQRPRLDQEHPHLIYLRVGIHLYLMWYKQARKRRIASPALYCLRQAFGIRQIGLHFYHEIVFIDRLVELGCKRYIAYTLRKSLYGGPRAFWKVEYQGDRS